MISSIDTEYFILVVKDHCIVFSVEFSSVIKSLLEGTSTSFHSFCINNKQASITSFRLCGAIFVAIPTAIPIVPLHK